MALAESRIVAENVTVTFGNFVALRDISLVFHKHEFVCIVGTSGAGKTTLLRAMAGLIPVHSGQVLLDGRSVDRPTPHIGMIFQHFGLFPWKTVRANIEYGLKVQGRADENGLVDRLLEVMHLSNSAEKYPYQLSGGMQQRVGIARALALQPEVLLMDEPFGALDALTRETLQTELLGLWERQGDLAAVLITHDIDEAILMGDRIVVLSGPPGRVYVDLHVPIERPRDPRQIRFHPEYPRLRNLIWDALQADRGAVSITPE